MSGPGACPCAERARVSEAAQAPDACAVIVAGGVGSRFGDPRGKQFVELCGLPLACWSLLAFDQASSVGHIVLVCDPAKNAQMREQVLARVALQKPVTLAAAGAERQDSVRHGLAAVPARYRYVCVHDAARPLVTPATIEQTLAALRSNGTLAGAIAASRVTDTLKLVEGATVVSTPDRSFYWAAQTPQSFGRPELLRAHEAARAEGYRGTDDASLVEHAGGHVVCVESARDNIKVTLPEDFAIAEVLVQRRLMEGCGIDD